jgi:hypothetical protein
MRNGEWGEWRQTTPYTSLYLERNSHLPTGIRIDSFLTTDPNIGIFRIVVVNETNNSITLPSTTSLGQITFQKNQQINQVSEAKTESSKNLDAFRKIIPGIGEELRGELCTLLIEHQYSLASKNSDLGYTELVKHTIDTQGQGPIRQRAYCFSPHQCETAQETHGGGTDKPVAYVSRHFNKAELNYSTIEKEAAAVIFGIKRFRHYLQGKPFVIVSDHRPLQWFKTFKDETGRLGRFG